MAVFRLRPALRLRWGRCGALAVLVGVMSLGSVRAQDGQGGSGTPPAAQAPALPPQAAAPPTEIAPGGIYVLSQERLFSESAFGRRVQGELQRRRKQLATENDRIAATLEAEEKELTRKRPGMDPAAFRKLADAFDRKVENIRTRQARKNADLNAWAEGEQRRFFKAALSLIVALAKELQAKMILDDRLVIVSSGQVDITPLLIRRADSELGDGAAEAPPVWPAAPGTPDDTGQTTASEGGEGGPDGTGGTNAQEAPSGDNQGQ